MAKRKQETCRCLRMKKQYGHNFPHRKTWDCENYPTEVYREAFKPYGNYFSWEAHDAGIPSVGPI